MSFTIKFLKFIFSEMRNNLSFNKRFVGILDKKPSQTLPYYIVFIHKPEVGNKDRVSRVSGTLKTLLTL